AGAGRDPDDDGQEGTDLAEAQAHRGGGDDELVPPGRGEVDGLPQPVPEPGVLGLKGPEPIEELPSRRPALLLGRDGGLDLAGVVGLGGGVVDGRPTAWDLASPPGDVPPGPGEDGGGVGDPGRQGYGEHGGGLSGSWDGCAIPRPGGHPSPFREGRADGLRSV